MNISSINSLTPFGVNNEKNVESSNNGKSFQSLLDSAIKDVNTEQVDGYNAMEGMATGKVTNLQGAIQKIEEAELSMKLALEVKNKALSAYKEIMRMQV